MTHIQAKDLKVGDQYRTQAGTIQEVKEIVAITAKTIEYRTKRIAPDYYDGDFFQRPSLTKKLLIVNH